MVRRSSILLLLALLLSACGADGARQAEDEDAGTMDLPTGNVIDLSHPFNSETIYWPTAEDFSRVATAEGVTDEGYFYASGTFTSAEHGGTHIDAPIHFSESGQSVDQIPLDRLIGPAVVIDVSEHVSANADYRISAEDIQEWEAENRPVPDGSIVFFRTGFGEFWPDRSQYMGTDERGPEAVADLHFPGLDAGAARWLLENRSIKAVGIDTPSIDYGQSRQFETHQMLAGENIPALENVANLDQLPPEGAVVIALPMKIEGGSGGPVRIAALVP